MNKGYTIEKTENDGYTVDRESHKDFISKVVDASSLPAQTCRALAPESREDIAMYVNEKEGEQ